MTPEERDAEVRSWSAPPMTPPARRPARAAAPPPRNAKPPVEDPGEDERRQAENALRQLRAERAKQAHERGSGRPGAVGASMTARGQGGDVEALLERVRQARKSGWKPRST